MKEKRDRLTQLITINAWCMKYKTNKLYDIYHMLIFYSLGNANQYLPVHYI